MVVDRTRTMSLQLSGLQSRTMDGTLWAEQPEYFPAVFLKEEGRWHRLDHRCLY